MGDVVPSEVAGKGAHAVASVKPRLRGTSHAVEAVIFPALGLIFYAAVARVAITS